MNRRWEWKGGRAFLRTSCRVVFHGGRTGPDSGKPAPPRPAPGWGLRARPSPRLPSAVAALLPGRGILVWLLLWSAIAFGMRAPAALAQTEFVQTIETSLGDAETFWVQIPEGYDPAVRCPLLVGWHQLGGTHLEMREATEFDEIANERGWIVMSHAGVTATHWNNHPTQTHVVDVIRWIEERYAVDPARIYMVGASMGGAAGMVFSNNHLDPAGPMVAAAASMSGIQDCERRFLEQGINNSMIAAFGGRPEEVPFEYHRNSAIFFADSMASMHTNARHLPLWLTFGHGDSDQVWREHAEDLYAVMASLADTVVLRESAYAGHGWGCAEERLICDFLERFTLDPLPAEISVNADAEGDWYWTRLEMRNSLASFARFDASARIGDAMREGARAGAAEHLEGQGVAVERGEARVDVEMIHNVARLDLDLAALAFPFENGSFLLRWNAGGEGPASLGVLGVPSEPELILKDGSPYTAWVYDGSGLLLLAGEGDGEYRVYLDASSVGDSSPDRLADDFDGGFLAPSVIRLDQGVACVLPAGPALSWSLFDPLGRLVASGREPARACEQRTRLLLPGGLSSGAYLLRLQSNESSPVQRGHAVLDSARMPVRAVRRLTILR